MDNTDIEPKKQENEVDIRYDHLYKMKIVILVGDTSVGKTCILAKYVKGVFPISPIPTIAIEFATKVIQVKEGGFIKAQIWDTAGQDRYKAIVLNHYRRAVGALIVFDVTKRSTFENVGNWLNEIRTKAEKSCISYLVGNKIDLLDTNERRREVPYEEAKTFAFENKMKYFETSAYTSVRINTCFEELLQDIYSERRRLKGSGNVFQENNPNRVLYLNRDSSREEAVFGRCCD